MPEELEQTVGLQINAMNDTAETKLEFQIVMPIVVYVIVDPVEEKSIVSELKKRDVIPRRNNETFGIEL